MKNKIFFIQVMRIVACVGVFTGHFLGIALSSEISVHFLRFLRDGFMHKTVLSYLWQGDSDVVLFLVLSGLFITFLKNDSESVDWLKVVKKVIYVFIPSLIIIVIAIICQFLLYKFNCDSIFNYLEIVNDLKKLIVGGIPYYSYQLWYIQPLIVQYIVAYIFLFLFKNRKSRLIAYPFLYMLMYIKKISIVFFIGMLCGEICGQIRFKYNLKKFGLIIGCIAFFLSPFLFNEYNLLEINRVMLALAISIFILGMMLTGGKIVNARSGVIDIGDRLSFSFYLVQH